MTDTREEFSFGDDSVASAYDNVLVPVLFRPWAARLIEEHGPWHDRLVLDLATGTGIVAQMLAAEVGPGGRVLGADINGEMLALAKERCAGTPLAVEFIECSAYPLEVAGDSIDVLICQQGFQFMPDKRCAAEEALRVLRPGGKVVATTWQPVEECQFFGAICDASCAIGEPQIADMMQVPFNFMPGEELVEHFESAGFECVRLERQEQDLVMHGGIEQAIKVAFATPIGPRLRSLPPERQAGFRDSLTGLLRDLSDDGTTMGRMVANSLTAWKQDERSS